MNANVVILVGRLTRDPEERAFSGGGKVASFGLAVSNRAFVDGEWKDKPVFVDCSAFNNGERGMLATNVMKFLRKGKPVYIEGKLVLDEWEDKNGGGKRSKLRVVANSIQFLFSMHPDNEKHDDSSGVDSNGEVPF